VSNSRILIVEDEQIVASELQRSLQARGYDVSIAEDGEKALAQIAATAPNLVLLDVVLPGPIDGIGLAEKLQGLNIPVVYITGYSDNRLFHRARETEPYAYLSKPLQNGELDRVVQLALLKRSREQGRESERQRQAKELRESEERLRRMVEQVSDYCIFTLDLDGRVNNWNIGAERITGYSAKEVLGRSYALFFSAEDESRNIPAAELEQARTQGSADDTRWLVRRSGEQYWAEGALTSIRDENGTITGYTKVSRDTTGRRRIEDALRERDERLRVALQAARTGTWRWDLRTDVDIIDESLRGLFGLTPNNEINKIGDFYAIVHPEERAKVIASFERTRHEGVHLNTEFRVIWPDGSEHWLLDQGEVIRDQEGHPVSLTGACVDIHDRKLAEQALRENEERFRLYSANIRDYALMQVDTEGRVVSWNFGAAQVFGYSEGEILGQPLAVLFTTEDVAKGEPAKEREQAITTGRSIDERWHVRKGGSRFWASGVLSPMRDEQGRLRGFAKVLRDETERRRANERLRASLDEKEVLLQEIHHRVKNNLQVINSLLRLQSEHIADRSSRELLVEAQSRVQAIAGIHELLYRSPDLARIDFGTYLNRLARNLFSFYGISEEQVQLVLHVNHTTLEVSQAIPCGLIVNELLTNALKYAFPGGRRGTTTVSLDCVGRQCVLVVEDNGVGLPEGFDWEAAETLGLQLVKILAGQLDGTVQLNRSSGTRFEISFPGSSTQTGSLGG